MNKLRRGVNSRTEGNTVDVLFFKGLRLKGNNYITTKKSLSYEDRRFPNSRIRFLDNLS